MRPEGGLATRPFESRELRHRHTTIGGGYCRREQSGKGRAAKALAQQSPAGYRSRYCDGMDAALRHLGQRVRLENVDRDVCRRPAARVQAVQPTRCRVEHHREQIATDAVHHRRDDAHHGIRGNRGVDRMTAGGERHDRRLRCQRVLGRRDPEGRHHHGAPLESVYPRTGVIDPRGRATRNRWNLGPHG